jgi:general secretion pathway protein H
MVLTDRKGELVQQPISPAARGDSCDDAGFTLLEVVCILAILAVLSATVVPALPSGTSRTQLEGFTIATAALLKADRNAAMRRRTQIATEVDAASRLVRSGATGRVVRVPNDVTFDALLSAACDRPAGNTIRFFSSGMSCGGVIALTRSGVGYEIRINWLTGGIEIAPRTRG